MKYDYDVVVIGLGPAGMAVTAMASSMGLSVFAVEKDRVGGECMNVGCIPSKALLRMAKTRHLRHGADADAVPNVELGSPFERIARHLAYIAERKTMGPLLKAEIAIGQGTAEFCSPHEIAVGDRVVSAKRIFICTGTSPAVPDIANLRAVQPLTNENLFQLEAVPSSLMILGAGAIACEMAQAFARLGTEVSMVFRGPRLLRREDPDVAALVEERLTKDGVKLYRNADMQRFDRDPDYVSLRLGDGTVLKAEHVLCALGRHFDPAPLRLDRAGVEWNARGITVDKYLRTSQPHIFACGDVNGEYQFSHAAMHQGMVALMNCFLPGPLKRDFRRYPVPWTIFTDPPVSRVGQTPEMLRKAGVAHEIVEVRYADYGAAVAEEVDLGFVRAAVSPWGRVLGVTIVGENSGEMINEWATVIQNRISLLGVAMQQHSFPTMGFLSKRVAETWLMRKMDSPLLQRIVRALF